MAARRDRVYPDTATLYPISIADLLLRVAEAGLIELVWSDYLLDETTRVLVEDKGLAHTAATYFCDCIRETFPNGHIPRSSYEHLIATRTGPDPADHEHSAAAVAAHADVILAADRKGFPTRDTSPAVRRRPDDYFTQLLGEHPDEILAIVEAMGHDRRPRSTIDETLTALRNAGLRDFAVGATSIR